MSDTIGDYRSLDGGASMPASKKRGLITAGAAIGTILVVVIVVLAVLTAERASAPPPPSDEGGAEPAPAPGPPSSLADAMAMPRLMGHLEELLAVAEKHNNSRSVENGYNASVEYVQEVLAREAPDLRVWTEPFDVELFREVVPPALSMVGGPHAVTYAPHTQFIIFDGYAGAIDVTATTATPSGASTGCAAADFAGFPNNSLAVIERGGCSFRQKFDNAANAGAAFVVIYNNGSGTNHPGPFHGTLGNGTVPIPCISVGYLTGVVFSSATLQLRLQQDLEPYTVTSLNLFAETPYGDENSVVVSGSHLDSVPAGPGINDNGSGSSINLEMAIQLGRVSEFVNVRNKVRFAWWGAEELGLLGSRAYVASLSEAERSRIAVNLNNDMVASPNFYRGVYNGAAAEQADIRNGSAAVADIITDYFGTKNEAWDYTDFDGRSDYGPFIENGIPAGGLFSGAEKIKTQNQRKRYGGLADAAYDPSYHAPADTLENISQEALISMATATAHALQSLAERANLKTFLRDYTP